MQPEDLLEARLTRCIQESSKKFMLDVYHGDRSQKMRRFHHQV